MIPDYFTSWSPAASQAQSPSTCSKFASIHEDVLAHIFLLLSRDADITWEPVMINDAGVRYSQRWDWVCVTEVCRYWYTVARETAKIWSYIDNQLLLPSKRTMRFLLLSRNADLTVDYPNNIDGNQFYNLKMILKHISRIRRLSLDLSYIGEAAELLHLLDHPAPRLGSIKLTVSRFSVATRFSLPVTSPDVLQHVELNGLDLSLIMSRLSGITNLSLTYCYGFSWSDLFEVFERSPRLSFISLYILPDDIRPSSIPKSVRLPYLVNAQLEFSNFSNIYDLLSNLDAPNIIAWKVCCLDNLFLSDVARMGVLSRLLRRVHDIRGMSISTSNAHDEDVLLINMGIIYEESSVPNPKEATLELPFRSADIDTATRHLIDIFGPQLANAPTLKIQGQQELLTEDSWRAIFRASACARAVEVMLSIPTHNNGGGIHCLKALGPLHSGEEHEVPCPALDQLLVIWYGLNMGLVPDISVLKDVLAARALRGSAVRVLSVNSGVPTRIYEEINELSQYVQELEWI